MTRRPAAVGALAALAAALLFVLAQPIAVHAQTAPEFDGFNLAADSSGVTVSFGDINSAPYPIAAGIVPQALATMNTGPSGYALASLMWPGATPGNAGSLAGLLLPVCVPDGNGICTPKAPPFATALNYPVRAEAQSPNGPLDAIQPGMTAHASSVDSAADAQALNTSAPGLFGVAGASAHTRTGLDQGKASATAKSVVTGFSAAGVIAVKSVTTEATGLTDGKSPTTSGSTIVEGLEINGTPASVDETGVHFGDAASPNPADQVVAQLNAQLFSQMGMEVFLTRPVQSRDGDTVRYRSGALVIVWNPQGGNTFVVTVGGSSVTAQATLGSVLGAVDTPSLDVPALDTTFDPTFAGTDLSAVPAFDTGAVPTTGAPLAPTGAVPAVTALDGAPVRYFAGNSAGNLVLALLGAILAAIGLFRFAGGALRDEPAESCPLEGSTK